MDEYSNRTLSTLLCGSGCIVRSVLTTHSHGLASLNSAIGYTGSFRDACRARADMGTWSCSVLHVGLIALDDALASRSTAFTFRPVHVHSRTAQREDLRIRRGQALQ